LVRLGPPSRPQRRGSARAEPGRRAQPYPSLRSSRFPTTCVRTWPPSKTISCASAPGRRHGQPAEDPKKLRLPLEVEGRLPAFFVTAHIYDPVPDKRFVVINSLKYTQGETTREKLKVEEILPDGVVLGFEGNRFYRRR
jgi:hypothetical protein